MTLKVGEIQITNFKKIHSANVKANGGHVYIMGKNGVGKSTIIQALFCLLTGKELPPNPITYGEQKGKIRIDLINDNSRQIEAIAELTFSDKNPKGKLTVKTSDGEDVHGGPRTYLDKLTQNLLFDPFEFAKKSPQEKVKEFKKMFNINFDALDKEYKELFESRKEINKRIKEVEGAIAQTDLQEHEIKLFVERKDTQKILDDISSAEQKNIDFRKAKTELQEEEKNLTTYEKGVEYLKLQKVGLTEVLHAHKNIESYLSILSEKAVNYNDLIKSNNQSNDSDAETVIKSISELSAVSKNIEARIKQLFERIEAGQTKINESRNKIIECKEALVGKEEVSVTELNERYTKAITFNEKVKKVEEYKAKMIEVTELREQSQQKTAQLENIRADKMQLIKDKGIPVVGLTFDVDKEELMYDGLPFDETQISTSKIISVGIELMMATSPDLRICRIKDGSLLDTDTMNELHDMINEQGFQAFIELVSPDKSDLEITVREV